MRKFRRIKNQNFGHLSFNAFNQQSDAYDYMDAWYHWPSTVSLAILQRGLNNFMFINFHTKCMLSWIGILLYTFKVFYNFYNMHETSFNAGSQSKTHSTFAFLSSFQLSFSCWPLFHSWHLLLDLHTIRRTKFKTPAGNQFCLRHNPY